MNTPSWDGAPEPNISLPTALGWVRALLRAVPLAILVFGCLILLLLVRLIERPIFKMARPITPCITVFVCRNALRLMRLPLKVHGTPMINNGILVANHTSWLDIFSLNASAPLYFVSKSEVAKWPGIGWLARATGTVFIQRDRRLAAAQTRVFQDRLAEGHKLLFFPEGTSTDGLQVVDFKSTLFEALFTDAHKDTLSVQPVSVVYHAPKGAEPQYYGWWGDMDFGTNLLRTLAATRQGYIEIMYHSPLKVSDFANRKVLSSAAETHVRDGHARMRNPSA